MYLQWGLASAYHMAANQWHHLCSCANLMRAKCSCDVLAMEEKPDIPIW